jgi:hypothetical protein
MASGRVDAQPVNGCTKDIECKGDRICDAGVCTAPPQLSAPVEAPSCTKDTDCPGALVCTSAVCSLPADHPAASHPAPQPVSAPARDFDSPPPSFTSPSPSTAMATSPTTSTYDPDVTATTEAEKEPRRSGFAASVSALLAFQAWDASGSPGGYPIMEASGVTWALMETSSIGGYISNTAETDYAMLLVQHYNQDGDDTSYGMLGLGLRGTGKNSGNSVQAALGLAWTTYANGTSLVGFGTSMQFFLGGKRSRGGLAIAMELDVVPDDVQTNTLFTVGIGGGFSR